MPKVITIPVSIVIPCHNPGGWLTVAIQSALKHSGNSFEVIVVDDASSDGSIDAAQALFPKVRVLRGDWLNGNSARNCGLAAAKGEWIQFLDADDELRPDKIATQLAAALTGDEVICSPLIVRNESTGEETVQRPTPDADLIEQWLRWELCQTGAALWRAESLRAIGGWKEGLPCCQDNELVLRALKGGLNFKYVDHPGSVYRIWSEETVCRKDPRRVIQQKTALIDDCLAWLEAEGKMTQTYRKAAAQACFEMARSLAKHDVSEAAAYFNSRRQLNLISLTGPAAPARFRHMERLLGFANAERIASWLR